MRRWVSRSAQPGLWQMCADASAMHVGVYGLRVHTRALGGVESPWNGGVVFGDAWRLRGSQSAGLCGSTVL
jgi:hypothetical protein